MILLPFPRRGGPTAAPPFSPGRSWRRGRAPTDPVWWAVAGVRPARATGTSACRRAATAESADGRFDRADSGRADRAREHRCAKPKEFRSARLAHRARADHDRRDVAWE